MAEAAEGYRGPDGVEAELEPPGCREAKALNGV